MKEINEAYDQIQKQRKASSAASQSHSYGYGSGNSYGNSAYGGALWSGLARSGAHGDQSRRYLAR